jgi:predicted nucleotidyltransferase
MTAVEPDVRALTERVSRRLLEQGARATLLTGSHARGQARDDSDIDVFAVGDGPRERVEVIDGRTVSVHWYTPEEARQRITSPGTAIVSVCGWRDAVVIDDPVGVGAELQREAREWSWDRVASEADAYVADVLVGRAEWVHKLVSALRDERRLDAAAVAAETAIAVGRMIAINVRLVAQSENGLWPAIVDAAPPEWGEPLAQALRGGDEDLETAARAALLLYGRVARDLRDLFDENEWAIVEHALGAADSWPEESC